MAWTYVLVLLAFAFVAVNAGGDTFCGKRTRKSVTIEQGDKVVFKTQGEKAKKYMPNVRCIATYKLGSTCSEMKLSCSTSRISNKDKRKCMKGDKIIVIGKGGKKSEKFCGTRKPRKTVKRGAMKIIFFSDKKNNAPGATCFVKCSSKEQPVTPAPVTPAPTPDEVLLLVGGEDNNGNNMNSSEVYGSPTCSVPDLPSKKKGVNSVYFDNQVLACGGYGYLGSGSYGYDDMCYALNSNGWSPHSNMTSSRDGATSVVVGGLLYMLGGYGDWGSGSESSSVILATGSTVWVPGPNIPGEVVFSCSVSFENGFIIIGSDSWEYGNQVINYNGNNWSNWANLTEGRDGHSCVLFEESIIVGGGFGSGNTLDSTVIINTLTKSNSPGPNMVMPRAYFAFANVNGLLLAVGGWNAVENTRTGEIFDPVNGGTLYQNMTAGRYYLLDGTVVPKLVLAEIIGCP